jgi:phosphoglycerol transferase MdoB-like AlkP superfamily enzyme
MVNRSATNLPNIPKTVRLVFATGIIFLLIMSLLRLALFLAFSTQGHRFMGVIPSFVLGIRYDLRYAGILALFMLLTGSLPFLDPFRTVAGRRFMRVVTGVAAFLLVFFYVVDFAHYSYLAQRLSASDLNYLTDAGISAKMVWETYPVIRILILLVVGTWGIRRLIRWRYDRIQRSSGPVTGGTGPVTRRSSKWVRTGWFVITFLLLAVAIFGRVGQYPLRWSDAFSLGSDYQANLSLNPFQSFFSSLRYRRTLYNEAKVRQALPVLAPYYGFDVRAADAHRPLTDDVFMRNVAPRAGALDTRPNVVLVICESFSAYKSSMWGNPLNTTPFFDSLCKGGLFFDRCFTPTYGTARGVWAVITGIPDVAEPQTTSSRNPAAVDQHSIINDFKGYDKHYFLGGSTSWANIRGFLANNIDGLHLHEEGDYSAPRIDVWGISDKNLFLEANKVLKKEQGPFFAVIQTSDNHRPYTIPAEDKETFKTVTAPADTLHKYGFASNDEMNAFRYTDFAYRTFIEAASKEKYFHNTVFLFVGDHGIPGETGPLFPRAWTDQRLSCEHVPLLIWAPGMVPARRSDRICSQVDVLPTLAGLCGIPYRNTTLGRDLLDTARTEGKEFAFIYDLDQSWIGVVQGNYYYRRQQATGREVMVSVVDDSKPSPAVMQGPVKQEMERLSEAVYETGRYMLLMNKKRGD